MAEETESNRHVIDQILRELNTGFVYPPPLHTDGLFVDSMIRALYYSDISYGVNPILLANIFFLLEQYFYQHYGMQLKSRTQ
jgi:hypothetical protein